MNTTQLQEKRNKVMADAMALTAGENITAEQRSQFDVMLADVTSIDADIVRVKAVEQYQSEQRNAVNAGNRPNPGESNDPAERVEVRDARVKASFRKYMATGAVETRDLTVAGSGVAIPILFNPQVIEAQKSYGEIYDIVNVLKTDHGNPIKMVLDNDTSNGLISVTVGVNASEVDPAISGTTLQVDNFSTGVIRVDNGLLTDAGFDLEAFIRDKFAKRFYRGASSLILNGDAGGSPPVAGAVASLTAGYATTGFTSAVTNKLGYADFASAIGTLDPAYQTGAVWLCYRLDRQQPASVVPPELRRG